MKQRIQILIVEDEILSAMTLEAIFKRWGYEDCRIVAGAEDALEYMQHEEPDLVLLDIALGGDMDGIELAEKMGERSQAQIIFMTGYDAEFVKERTASLHALACLTKPMDLDHLKDIIESAFSS